MPPAKQVDFAGRSYQAVFDRLFLQSSVLDDQKVVTITITQYRRFCSVLLKKIVRSLPLPNYVFDRSPEIFLQPHISTIGLYHEFYLPAYSPWK